MGGREEIDSDELGGICRRSYCYVVVWFFVCLFGGGVRGGALGVGVVTCESVS